MIPVPDSGTPHAIGYAQKSGIPYSEGLIKSRYIGRTFIEPTDQLRKVGVAMKFNPLPDNLKGRRVVMVDDSIVRGNTSGPLVQLLRDAGAKEVHVRVACPPIRFPCFMGVDMASQAELIAANKSLEEICEHIGADSLAFLQHLRHDEGAQSNGRLLQCLLYGRLSFQYDDPTDRTTGKREVPASLGQLSHVVATRSPLGFGTNCRNGVADVGC